MVNKKKILIVEGNTREENSEFTEVGIKTHTESFFARFSILRDLNIEYQWVIVSSLYEKCCGLWRCERRTFFRLLSEWFGNCQIHSATVPKPLPPKPSVTIGATTRLRWGEFRAGKEL